PTYMHTLSLHDALPISRRESRRSNHIRQVLRTGDQTRRQGLLHHERGRSAGRHRWTDPREEEEVNGKTDHIRRAVAPGHPPRREDRKSTRLNSSHVSIS